MYHNISNYGFFSFVFFSGAGVHVTEQGDRYKGALRKGQRHGQGSLQAADGSHYSGSGRFFFSFFFPHIRARADTHTQTLVFDIGFLFALV